MKFTDEEWSRILSAHAGGQLVARGQSWDLSEMECTGGCVNQVAYDIPNRFRAYDVHRKMAFWFDRNFIKYWSPEQLIAGIEGVK